jgi:hypothetical protein
LNKLPLSALKASISIIDLPELHENRRITHLRDAENKNTVSRLCEGSD